jgi:hypothetical protein
MLVYSCLTLMQIFLSIAHLIMFYFLFYPLNKYTPNMIISSCSLILLWHWFKYCWLWLSVKHHSWNHAGKCDLLDFSLARCGSGCGSWDNFIYQNAQESNQLSSWCSALPSSPCQHIIYFCLWYLILLMLIKYRFEPVPTNKIVKKIYCRVLTPYYVVYNDEQNVYITWKLFR